LTIQETPREGVSVLTGCINSPEELFRDNDGPVLVQTRVRFCDIFGGFGFNPMRMSGLKLDFSGGGLLSGLESSHNPEQPVAPTTKNSHKTLRFAPKT